jgi:hypothetical protein
MAKEMTTQLQDRGLVILEGQGDRYIVLVPPDVIAWINREDTPGREEGQTRSTPRHPRRYSQN